MRVWEFEDNKAIPSDLVREQDFTMRVRRLNRLGTPFLIVNLVLTAVESLNTHRTALEAAQKRLQEFVKITGGTYAEMSNGDVFLSWEESRDTHALPAQLLAAVMPEDAASSDAAKLMLLFHMPEGYTPLRERINYYVELARQAAAIGENEPAQALQSDAARGPLTAWSVDQIEKLLEEIELRRYVRTQPIYEYQADAKWRPLCEEYFVSFADLKRDRFPKLDLVAPEHLFLELCRALDQNLLAELAEYSDRIAGRRIFLNLSVASVMGVVFARFCRSLAKEQHAMIGFELHRGDLLQDFSRTLDAIKMLHQENFKVALDGVTPDMANFVNLAAFDADYIKINVSKDRAAQLDDAAIREGLMRVPKEKLVFFRCDNERALKTGLEMGVSKFQGWLIDDAVKQAAGTPAP